jgi:thiaminase/transcriptional activator TenA
MKHDRFASELQEKTGRFWSAILTHPFVQAFGNGTLSRDRFEFYLRQDYQYLRDFARVLAISAGKADPFADGAHLDALIEGVNMELDLHRKTADAFGLTSDDLETTPPALITIAYTSYLLRLAHEGRGSDVAVALLPCAAGYVEIAETLQERGLPDDPASREWIETHTSDRMYEIVDWHIARVNEYARHADAGDKAKWLQYYETSVRFELLFFEMAWTKTLWPECLP